jgi:peroxiredoxin
MKAKYLIISTSLITLFFLTLLCSCGAPAAPAKIGDPAPSFSAVTISGETKSLSNFTGKPIMIVFEGCNCPECDKQRPFTTAALKSSGKSINVVTIFINTICTVTPEYVKQHSESEKIADYSTVLIDKDNVIPALYELGKAAPMTVLIDSKGIIKDKKVGRYASQQEVETALKTLN